MSVSVVFRPKQPGAACGSPHPRRSGATESTPRRRDIRSWRTQVCDWDSSRGGRLLNRLVLTRGGTRSCLASRSSASFGSADCYGNDLSVTGGANGMVTASGNPGYCAAFCAGWGGAVFTYFFTSFGSYPSGQCYCKTAVRTRPTPGQPCRGVGRACMTERETTCLSPLPGSRPHWADSQ